jgi:ferric-dicitrate binding protein FerR (iron transport regulator)
MGAPVTPKIQNEINELLFRLLDNELCDSDLVRLNEWLQSDPQSRLYYCQFMEDYSALTLGAAAVEDRECRFEQEDDGFDDNFWRQMVEEEKNAPALKQLPEEKLLQIRPENYEQKPAARRVHKTSLAAALISAAALLILIAMAHLTPSSPEEVATVVDCLHAQWSSGLPLQPGTRITSLSKPIRLTEGIVKLVTDQNVEVVLESPTEFTFQSYSEICLGYGKLFARVSPQGLGFSVATPNSKIVDLGTEFGILCHINGNTEVYLYKGKANLFAGEKNANKTSLLLTAGSARQVHHRNSDVQEIALEANAVVRNINSKAELIWKGQSLCLADIVGGGNGFGGGHINTGIDTVTGEVIDQLRDLGTHIVSEGYRPVRGNRFVDGVFVPGINPAGTQITSGGAAVRFPATSGALWGYIFDGAMHEGTTTRRHSLQLDGTAYGTPETPAITLHSNQGITFDLSMIRKTIADLDIHSFAARIGVSQTVSDALEQEKGRTFDDFPAVKKVFDAGYSKVEFWVFLDGKEVFHQVQTSAEKARKIDIPISEKDHFLTLAVTESDDTHAYDWALWGRPELILETAGMKPESRR